MRKDIEGNEIKGDPSTWDRLSEEEKTEIKEKAKLKREEMEKEQERKRYDIRVGRQRTIFDW